MSDRQTYTELPEEIRRALSESAQESVHLLARLVALPSHFGGPVDIQQTIRQEFDRIGLATELIESHPDDVIAHPEYSPPTTPATSRVVSVSGRWPGAGEGQSLLLFAHYDTEPVHHPEQWETPPLMPTVKASRMYGLGTADSKAGLVSMITAVSVLRRADFQPQGALTLLSIQGKGGGIGGLTAFSRIEGADAAIYSHPAETGKGIQQLKTSSRGLLQFEIEFTGLTPEPIDIGIPTSGDPRQGINAIEKAIAGAQVVQEFANRHDVILNIGTLHGGDAARIVPDRAVLSGSLWFENGSWRQWFEQMTAFVLEHDTIRNDRWLQKHPPRFAVIGTRANPASVDPDGAFVATLQSAIRAVSGQTPDFYTWHTASDIRVPMLVAQIPTIGLGAVGGNFYGPNEWVDLDSMHQVTEVLVRAIVSWCGIEAV